MSVLEVLLNETAVGTITHLPGDRSLFVFDEGYAQDEQRPALSLSFKTSDGGVATTNRPTRTRVAPFFSNLLPEGHLRRYLARIGGVHDEREFFLLWLLGQDLPGAVIVRPPDGMQLPPTSGDPMAAAVPPEDILRFSLAGVQLKFSAVMEADGGLTIPVGGMGGAWIVKLPSPRYPSVPEVEYAMMELARGVGIEVPEVRLVEPSRLTNVPEEVQRLGKALAVQRFDRTPQNRHIHIEDFAQVFDVFPERRYENASYENIASVLWAEGGLPSVTEFARRLAFTALIGNADMHLKNWSIIYRDGRSAELAPAYDFVPTIAYLPADTRMALSLGGSRQMHSVDVGLFQRFANQAGLPEHPVVEAARETAERTRSLWKKHPALDVMPSELRSMVTRHMDSVPLGK